MLKSLTTRRRPVEGDCPRTAESAGAMANPIRLEEHDRYAATLPAHL